MFTGSAVFLELLAGLLLATALNITTARARPAAGVLLIIPMILTPVIIGLMFNFALNPLFGPLAKLIDGLGIGVRGGHPGGRRWARSSSLVLVDVWQWTPLHGAHPLGGHASAAHRRPAKRPQVDGALGASNDCG